MKIAVSPVNGWIVPSSVVALSKSRSEVVPTATMRPPAARAAFSALRGRGVEAAPFGVHAVPVGVVRLDRQEGPCPDVQGQPVDSDPARAQRAPPARS